jgi:NAD(P)-dependent dehydrogenase (short-subunit alcohol dehydrogenase family)
MRDLAGKTAFVTGAASGIGFGIATALAQAGVKVMLCDIEEAALTKAAADLKLTNADVDGVKADVSLKGELQAAADATVARYGKIHILVNNAGVGGGSSYGRWTDASWNWTLSVTPLSKGPETGGCRGEGPRNHPHEIGGVGGGGSVPHCPEEGRGEHVLGARFFGRPEFRRGGSRRRRPRRLPCSAASRRRCARL